MTVLILAGPQAESPDLRRVLSGLDQPVVVIGEAADDVLEQVDHIRIEDWESGEVEYQALRLAERHPVRRVVATSVRDHARAARLRDRLGLGGSGGSGGDITLRLRDRLQCMRLAADAGLPVVAFAAVDTIEDLLAFASSPVLVGQRCGDARPRLLSSWADIDRWACALPTSLDEPLRLVAEEGHPYSRFRVAGVACGGRWLWSIAGAVLSPLDAAHEAGVMLGAAVDELQELAGEAIRCVSAGFSEVPASVQVDLVRHPTDGLRVASIEPASPVARAVAALAYGCDLDAADIRAQAGLPLAGLPPAGPRADRGGQAVGWCSPADRLPGLDLLGVMRGCAVVGGVDDGRLVAALSHLWNGRDT